MLVVGKLVCGTIKLSLNQDKAKHWCCWQHGVYPLGIQIEYSAHWSFKLILFTGIMNYDIYTFQNYKLVPFTSFKKESISEKKDKFYWDIESLNSSELSIPTIDQHWTISLLGSLIQTNVLLMKPHNLRILQVFDISFPGFFVYPRCMLWVFNPIRQGSLEVHF